MGISAADPVSPAIERTREILFRPFQAGKWFVLGFCAWLAELGQSSGGGGAPPISFSGDSGPGGGGVAAPGRLPGMTGVPGAPAAPGMPPEVHQAIEWIAANLGVILGIVAAVVLLMILFVLFLTWLQSRFSFIFLDNVVLNRAEVVEPWREFRHEGNSLCGFRVALVFVSCLVFLALMAVSVLVAWPDIRAWQFGGNAMAATMMVILGVLASSLVLYAIQVSLVDFVVPIMYLRRQGVMASWQEFREDLLPGHAGQFALYLLFRVVVMVAIAFIAMGLTCATCCLTVLPYIGSVILLPLSVFLRQYSLFYLEQFGPPWHFFAAGKTGRPEIDFLDA